MRLITNNISFRCL